MSTQRNTPDIIARAQELIGRITGISSCRISSDCSGRITEVHVVATDAKPAKLVARDVETCLQEEIDDLVGVFVPLHVLDNFVFINAPTFGGDFLCSWAFAAFALPRANVIFP